MTRRGKGAYQPDYPKEVISFVKDCFNHHMRYEDIAAQVRYKFKTRFTKNNVAGMIHRLRRHGELDRAARQGGVRSKRPTSQDKVRPAPITLAKVW